MALQNPLRGARGQNPGNVYKQDFPHFLAFPSQQEFQLPSFGRWTGWFGAGLRKNLMDAIGQSVEAERRNAEEAQGNDQESFAQDFQL